MWKEIYPNVSKLTKEYFSKIPKITKSQSLDIITITNSGGGNLKRTHSVIESKDKISKTPRTGILATTEDAYTLTDGPTIFLCEDVAKIGKFYIQQSSIPNSVFQELMSKILKNNKLALGSYLDIS